MATLTFMQSFLTINAALIAAVEQSAGLGALAVVGEEGATPFAASVGSAVDAAGVAVLLAAGNIAADTAAQATAVFSGNLKPTIVHIGTHTSIETPAIALDNLVTAEIDFGVVAVASVADTDLAAVGTWLNTDDRKLRYVIFGESRTADMLTSGKPTGLTTAEIQSFRILYGASDIGTAGAAAGIFSGKGLIGGPATAQPRISGQDLPGITTAEALFVLANNAGLLTPEDVGASAAERVIRGVETYSGASFTAVTTLNYVVRLTRVGLTALASRKASLAEPLLSNAVGVGEVVKAINDRLAPAAGVGHFNPGTSDVNGVAVTLSNGYQVTAVASGTTITATVLVRLNQEIFQVVVNITGEVI
jgi:hypothetical protein